MEMLHEKKPHPLPRHSPRMHESSGVGTHPATLPAVARAVRDHEGDRQHDYLV